MNNVLLHVHYFVHVCLTHGSNEHSQYPPVYTMKVHLYFNSNFHGVETQIDGFLNSWFCSFQYTHLWKSPTQWEPNSVDWPSHENWYPTNYSTFTVYKMYMYM